jgi:hypothetical protein
VLLSPLVTGSRVWSAGVVVDAGTGNRIVRLNSTTQKQLPPECQPILQDCGV